MEDEEPKSAYEVAMARLNKKDADAGIEHVPPTDAQKAAIAEARNFCEAKLAEREVLHESTVRRVQDAEALRTIDDEYRRDRERLTSDRDAKIERIRRGATAS
jgi:LPS O-antigen subunit length determinant protein (WzzB/FepE family)